MIRPVILQTLSFPAFMDTALYHHNGKYSSLEYQTEMPMMPQMTTPLFGRVIGSYLSEIVEGRDARFVGIGAGEGFLDYDLIHYLTSPRFSSAHEKSTFLITDKIITALPKISSHLSPLKLNGRLDIQQWDVLDASLPKGPFGVVYANEIIDALPTDFILEYNERIWSVRVACVPIEMSLEDYFASHDSLETSLQFLDHEQEKVEFVPFFFPLASLPVESIYEKYIPRLKEKDFNGMYPIHCTVRMMFENIKASFDHGIVVLIDYHSEHEGQHNWNVAVNHFRNFQFGSTDVDVQWDASQIIEHAKDTGYSLRSRENLAQFLVPRFYTQMDTLNREDIKRWCKFNRSNPTGMEEMMELLSGIAQSYDILTFEF